MLSVNETLKNNKANIKFLIDEHERKKKEKIYFANIKEDLSYQLMFWVALMGRIVTLTA